MLSSAVGTDNQTVCSVTPITNITYAFGGSATGVTVTGLPAGLTSNVAGTTLTISGSPTAAGTYTVTTTGPCAAVTASGTITLTPAATLNLTSAAGTNNQTVCSATPITSITYTFGGSATGVTVTGLPAGLTSNVAGTTLTISGSPTAAGTYTVTTTGPCAAVTANGTITLNPPATITLSSAAGTDAQTVCSGTAITTITYTLGGSATGANITVLPAGLTSSVVGTTVTISGTPTAGGTYTVTTTGPCAAVTANGTITLNPSATIILSSAAGTDAQTVCSGTPIVNITYTIGGGATGATVTGLPAGLTSNVAGTTVTISGSPTAAGTYTVTTVGGCTPVALNGTITLTAPGTLTLTSANNTQTVCSGTPIVNITYTIGGGATGATVTGLPAGLTSNVAGTTVTISGSPTAAGTYTVTTVGGCTPVALNGTITLTAPGTLTLTSANNTQTVCSGTPIVNITYTIGGGATGANITGLPAGLTSSVVGTTLTISGSPTAAGTYTVTTTGPCAAVTANGTITLNPPATITLSSAAGTDAQTVCSGTAITTISYTLGGSATGANITVLPAGLTSSVVGTTVTISGTPTAGGTYTVTTTGPCAAVTANGTITLNPPATIILSSAAGTDAQTVCSGTPIVNITYTIGGGATGATVTGLPAGLTSNVAGTTVTISGSPTAAGTYTVTTVGGCTPVALNGTITLTAPGTLTLTSANNIQTVCSGTPIVNITYTIGGGATGATVTGLPAGLTSNVAGTTVTISGSPTAAGTYTVTTVGGCTPVALNGTITLTAPGTLTLTSANNTQTVCSGTPIVNITYTIGRCNGSHGDR